MRDYLSVTFKLCSVHLCKCATDTQKKQGKEEGRREKEEERERERKGRRVREGREGREREEETDPDVYTHLFLKPMLGIWVDPTRISGQTHAWVQELNTFFSLLSTADGILWNPPPHITSSWKGKAHALSPT